MNMLSCPHKGCHGVLDEGSCTGCGKFSDPLQGLGRDFPPPERVVREQEAREDFAVREA